MQPTPAQIRANVLYWSKLFLANNCQYNNQEEPVVKAVLDVLIEPDENLEEVKRHQREINY